MHQGEKKVGNEQVWVEEDGDYEVVKLATSLVRSLKEEVCNTFVATVGRFETTDRDIQSWLFPENGITAEVRCLTNMLYWIKPLSREDYSKIVQLGVVLYGSIVRRIDRWTEVLGPLLHPYWIHLEGIRLHAWDERVFLRLGECFGVVMEVDEEAKQRR